MDAEEVDVLGGERGKLEDARIQHRRDNAADFRVGDLLLQVDRPESARAERDRTLPGLELRHLDRDPTGRSAQTELP